MANRKLLSDLIMEAIAADDAFEEQVKAHGYKSRWDVKTVPQQSQALRDAYFAKVDADKAAHEAWEASRAETNR